ncbi:pseudouridylate synthase 7 homolog [Diorhabda sublineata]|uniref:pseudouridylate synthase 7 homolog n=1 Tax=Diorhabda sublineata TaxID=1163346 RepID=UPI0024E0479D|nr:pseudouridylate synthase 7 homolog [Diorhabda sublineata]
MPPKRGRPYFKSQNAQCKQSRHQEYRHYDQLSEKDVGITEYLGNLEGFSGIIKARYSDFQLNEIDLDGNMAKLTDTSIPKDFTPKMTKHNYNEVQNSPNKHIPQEIWEAIKTLANNGGTDTESISLNIEHLDKEERLELHTCIKSYFGQKVIASTVSVDNKRHIQIKKYEKEMKQDVRSQWPPDKGEYVYFILYKEKMDTLEAAFKISNALNISTGKFTHAGNKDRRSISSQWFCVHKVEPWKLITKTRKLFNIKVGNITFKDTPLQLGQLKGNRFRIALRNVTCSDDAINKALNYLNEHGFINYYGLQRFGNDKDVPTFKVGISLLQGKWKEAIDQILKPKLSDDPSSNQGDIIKAKNIYAETGNAKEAYKVLQRNKSSVEGKLLEGLNSSAENDYVNALEKIPRSMRLLYIHAFQSLIWNKMVSKRLQLFGMKPVAGDLVLSNKEESNGETELIEQEEDHTTTIKRRKQVKTLTEDDLGNYSMYDIVMTLPGYDVIYPEHLKQFYKESVEECGLDLEMSQQSVKTYNLSGDYRNILGRPQDLTWKIVSYNDPTDNLIMSDLQEMKGDTMLQTVEDGKYKAVIMEFTLFTCHYATMLLRQIMKVDTATSVHSKLNDYHVSNKVKNFPKISVESEPEVQENETNHISNSLLTDPLKYELFKKTVFNTVESTTNTDDEELPLKKRKLEENT